MTIQSFIFNISKHFHYVIPYARIFASRSLPINDLKWPVHSIVWSWGTSDVVLFVCFLLSPNRYFQFHSSIIRIHFACIITLNKQEMNFRWCFLCCGRCGMFSAFSSHALSQMIYISYWMAVKREISPTCTLSFSSPYADHLVEKVILSSLYHRRTVES